MNSNNPHERNIPLKHTQNILAAVITALVTASHAHALVNGEIKRYDTKAKQAVAAPVEGAIGYAADSNTFYLRTGSAWTPIGASPEYSLTFNEGAGKGWAMLKYDGTAFSGSALVVNLGYAGPYRLAVTDGITSTIIPATEATGLDITSDASAANNDAVELFGGVVGASGRPFIIGTDPAFKFCVQAKLHDVSGTDGFYIGLRSLTTAAAAITTYTDFAAIGNISGDIKITTDLANAGETVTDTTDNWADDETHTECVLVSSAGAVTYTTDGVAPTATAAYTFADGLLVIPFVYEIQDSDIADDSWLISWTVALQ